MDLIALHQSFVTKEPVYVDACVELCSEISYSFCIIFYATLYDLLTVWTIISLQKSLHYWYYGSGEFLSQPCSDSGQWIFTTYLDIFSCARACEKMLRANSARPTSCCSIRGNGIKTDTRPAIATIDYPVDFCWFCLLSLVGSDRWTFTGLKASGRFVRIAKPLALFCWWNRMLGLFFSKGRCFTQH